MSRTVRTACLLRGSVARDHHHRDIIDLPQTEGSGRIFSALTGIFLALEMLGLRERWCWKIVRKIALDCAPGLRTKFVQCALQLQTVREPIRVPGIYPMLAMSNGVLTRVLEDIKLLGILVHDGDEQWYVEPGVAKVLKEWEEDQ